MVSISEDDFEQSLETDATTLVEFVRDEGYDDPIEAVSDVLDGKPWFTNTMYGPANHGTVIEYANADPTVYSDWQGLAESDDPATMVKRIAYYVYEAAVIERAKERIEQEEGDA